MDNDLISRAALKAEIDKLFERIGGYDSGLVMNTIDNAPTVEYPFYQEAYQTGYEEGKNERQIGKWIVDTTSNRMKCPFCGATENANRILVDDMNFCYKCGADMRKEEANNE